MESSARLLVCPACDSTYLTTTMDTCPECEADLTEIPDERDLGYIE